ncbi:MAG: HD domain-containing protein [Chloroflexi bacterium]|nr:HD domain-containing protein [Chloroflexota bacterium]
MTNRRTVVYLAIVHTCTIAVLLLLFSVYGPVSFAWSDILFWIGAGLAAHAVQFDIAHFETQRMRVSVGLAVTTANLTLFSPPLAALIISVASLSARDLTGKTDLSKLLFNRSMFALCGGAGAVVFQYVNGLNPGQEVWWFIVASLVAAVCYGTLNTLLVAIAVAFSSGRSVYAVWRSASSTLTHVSYLTLGAYGATLSLTYTRVSPLAVVLLGLPLVASYYGLRNSALVRQFYTQVVQSLADSLDLREHETAGHTQRIAVFAQRLGAVCGMRGGSLESLYVAGLLHDVGKLGMPDRVLLKPGSLTAEEWEVARRHPADGAQLLEPYEHLREVAGIVRHHHERFDGSGYPDGLAGDAIPLGSRIISVVDAFDAMYFGRPYRRPYSWEEARDEIERNSGSQFDPAVVSAFLTIHWPGEVELLRAQGEHDAHE